MAYIICTSFSSQRRAARCAPSADEPTVAGVTLVAAFADAFGPVPFGPVCGGVLLLLTRLLWVSAPNTISAYTPFTWDGLFPHTL